MKITACCCFALLGLATLGPAAIAQTAPASADKAVRIELNAAETVQNRCRLSFVIENKKDTAFENLKLDLVVFGRDGGIQRRLVTEMAPLRASKTIVKAFEIEGECAPVGSILVNDVTACTPGTPAACLDQIALESRVANVRLFK